MIKTLRIAVLACVPVVLMSSVTVRAQTLQDGLDVLIAAYPDHLNRREPNLLVWHDGTRMTFDDGRGGKDFETLLTAPDLEDQFYTPYLMGDAGIPPGLNKDPGRVRYEPFFRRMYGDCRKGRRPSFIAAAQPEKADEMYQAFITNLNKIGINTKGGIFQAYMDVELVNDGPVTILLDSQKLF